MRLGGHPSIAEFPVFALAPYQGPLMTRIHRLKYGDEPGHALRIALAMAEHRALLPRDAVLVPIPMHPVRFAERGYNQPALLARYLARIWRVELASDLLRKTRPTAQQAGLSWSERNQNLIAAFSSEAGAELDRLREKNLVLIDDVVTTGSTLRAAAAVLITRGLPIHSAYCAAIAGEKTSQDQL